MICTKCGKPFPAGCERCVHCGENQSFQNSNGFYDILKDEVQTNASDQKLQEPFHHKLQKIEQQNQDNLLLIKKLKKRLKTLMIGSSVCVCLLIISILIIIISIPRNEEKTISESSPAETGRKEPELKSNETGETTTEDRVVPFFSPFDKMKEKAPF